MSTQTKDVKIKTCKIWVDFGPLQSSIAHISGTDRDIHNRKDMWSRAIPPAFGEKSPVNFGPLTTQHYMCNVKISCIRIHLSTGVYFHCWSRNMFWHIVRWCSHTCAVLSWRLTANLHS